MTVEEDNVEAFGNASFAFQSSKIYSERVQDAKHCSAFELMPTHISHDPVIRGCEVGFGEMRFTSPSLESHLNFTSDQIISVQPVDG